MVKINLNHVVRDIDRHGNDRFYFRVKDQQKVRLLGIPGSEEFMEAYQDSLRKQTTKQVACNVLVKVRSRGCATLISIQRLSKRNWHHSLKPLGVAYS